MKDTPLEVQLKEGKSVFVQLLSFAKYAKIRIRENLVEKFVERVLNNVCDKMNFLVGHKSCHMRYWGYDCVVLINKSLILLYCCTSTKRMFCLIKDISSFSQGIKHF